MEGTKFDTISEKLNTVAELSKEIEVFTHKQTELFEALNQKFPTIEQFSNALKDANELFTLVGHLTKCVNTCQDELKSAKLLLKSKQEREGKIKQTRYDICEIMLKVDELDDKAVMEELKLLFLKINKKRESEG